MMNIDLFSSLRVEVKENPAFVIVSKTFDYMFEFEIFHFLSAREQFSLYLKKKNPPIEGKYASDIIYNRN